MVQCQSESISDCPGSLTEHRSRCHHFSVKNITQQRQYNLAGPPFTDSLAKFGQIDAALAGGVVLAA